MHIKIVTIASSLGPIPHDTLVADLEQRASYDIVKLHLHCRYSMGTFVNSDILVEVCNQSAG